MTSHDTLMLDTVDIMFCDPFLTCVVSKSSVAGIWDYFFIVVLALFVVGFVYSVHFSGCNCTLLVVCNFMGTLSSP